MLSNEGLASISRIKAMLGEITGGAIDLSEGAIAKWNKDLSGKLEPFIEEMKEKLLAQPVLRKDETGIRIAFGRINETWCNRPFSNIINLSLKMKV